VNQAPKLVLSTAPFFRRPLRDALRHAADAGFRAVEIMVTHDPSTQEPHLLRSQAADFGLEVHAIHAPFLLLTRRVWGPEPMGKVYRAVHLAEEVGAPVVVVHPPYRWQVRYRRWLETNLEEFTARTGVTVAVENMFPIRLGDRGVMFHAAQEFEELQRYPDLALDTSHAAVSNHDIGDFYRTYRSKLRHVHLSNNAGKGWDSHLPVYQDGVLPLAEFLKELSADGFAGAVSLELDLRSWLHDDQALHEVLVRNREFCEAAMASAPPRSRSRRR
jgi:sugar phosphate isomerase/epimerase